MDAIPVRLLSTEVAEVLRKEILSGRLDPGERLIESNLATTLGVSRGPVREALKLLRAEGLIGQEPNRGTFVISLTESDIREIYDLRAGLEARAARLLARAHRAKDVAALRNLLDEMVAAASIDDARGTYAADLALHSALLQLTGNTRLFESFNRTVPVLRALIPFDEFSYASLTDLAQEHRELIEAIEAGDEDAAARDAERHVEDGAAHVVSRWLTELGDSAG
jgi:GntR family transcriptional regulator, gluconate operon transcriptional repressor